MLEILAADLHYGDGQIVVCQCIQLGQQLENVRDPCSQPSLWKWHLIN